MEKFQNFIFLLVNIYLLGITTAHVSLTFPHARQLDLDFLDFLRSKPPCGMPKGKFRTTLMAGSKVNVTWHLSYPHRGGFRLELLDKNENVTMKLSDPTSTGTHVTGDPTAQWHTILVPERPCEDCTLRLIREAKEWKNYGYWSCADISIVKANDYKEDCLGRGKVDSNAMCMCKKGYWGPRCQYKDECSDGDCGTGKCIDIGGTTLPRKQCFCPAGFHGDRCQLKNKVTLPTPENLQLSSHVKTVLSDEIKLYHRVVSEGSAASSEKEIEFVVVVNGTSFIALGWRPESIEKNCQNMPVIEDDGIVVTRKTRAVRGRAQKPNPTLLEPLHMPERIMVEPESSMNSKRSTKGKSTSKPKPEPEVAAAEPEPVSNTEPEPEGEPKGEGSSKSITKVKGTSALQGAASEPKPEATSEPKSEPETVSEPKSEPEVTSEPKSEPETASEPKSEPEAASEPKSEPEAANEPKSEPEVTSEPKSEPQAASEPKAEPEATNEPHAEPEAESEPKPESASEPKSEPEATNEPHAEPEATSEPKSEPETASEPKSEPEATGEPASEPEASAEPHTDSSSGSPKSKRNPEPLVEPSSEPEKTLNSEPEIAAAESVSSVVFLEPEIVSKKFMIDNVSPYKLEHKTTSYTPKLDFHPMDCSDIVIGTARGMNSRIRDYYTRDRSTPRLDTYYGGTEDITSATGWELNGVTTIIFRRKIKTGDPTDHDLSGTMHFIWARGQEHGNYVHNPKSGLEIEQPSIPNFYAQDELKYHGQNMQRGITFIDF